MDEQHLRQQRRKSPTERRTEIIATAASIALAEGLERITLRSVADRLGVRPGLISHYFPAVEALVSAAFAHAVTEERRRILPTHGTPLERIALLVDAVQRVEEADLARLWLNARHLSRFSPKLAGVLAEQEKLNRDQLAATISEGIEIGEFPIEDASAACVRILVGIDGYSAYANNLDPFTDPAFARFMADIAEWALGLETGRLTESGH